MSVLKVDAIQDTSGNDQFTAKAWVLYNGLTNVINNSGNVSSLTDNAVARHHVTFANALSSATFAAGCSCSQPNYNTANISIGNDINLAVTTSSFPFFVQSGTGVDQDHPDCSGIFTE